MEVPVSNSLVYLTVKLTLPVLFVLALRFVRCAVSSSSFIPFQVMKGLLAFFFFFYICHLESPSLWPQVSFAEVRSVGKAPRCSMLTEAQSAAFYGYSRKQMLMWHTESLSGPFTIPFWSL